MRQPEHEQADDTGQPMLHTACGEDEEEEVVMLGKVWSVPTSGKVDSWQAGLVLTPMALASARLAVEG